MGKHNGGAGKEVEAEVLDVAEMEAVEVLVEKVAEVACFGDSSSSGRLW